jgi:RHS repeat-associated protein
MGPPETPLRSKTGTRQHGEGDCRPGTRRSPRSNGSTSSSRFVCPVRLSFVRETVVPKFNAPAPQQVTEWLDHQTSCSYDAHGAVSETNNLTDNTVTDLNPYRFAGGFRDRSTGESSSGRSYDPNTGRFTQQDALEILADPSLASRYPTGLHPRRNHPVGKYAIAMARFAVTVSAISQHPRGSSHGSGLFAARGPSSEPSFPSPLPAAPGGGSVK